MNLHTVKASAPSKSAAELARYMVRTWNVRPRVEGEMLKMPEWTPWFLRDNGWYCSNGLLQTIRANGYLTRAQKPDETCNKTTEPHTCMVHR